MVVRLGNNPEAALYKWSLTRVVGSSRHLRFSHNCLYIIFALYLQSQIWYTAAVGYKTGVGITINPYEFNILAYTLTVVFAIVIVYWVFLKQRVTDTSKPFTYCLLFIFSFSKAFFPSSVGTSITLLFVCPSVGNSECSFSGRYQIETHNNNKYWSRWYIILYRENLKSFALARGSVTSYEHLCRFRS